MSLESSTSSESVIGQLLKSALNQFGAGIAVAAVFAFATVRIYSDLERRTDAILLLVEKSIRTETELTHALEQLTENLKHVSRTP